MSEKVKVSWLCNKFNKDGLTFRSTNQDYIFMAMTGPHDAQNVPINFVTKLSNSIEDILNDEDAVVVNMTQDEVAEFADGITQFMMNEGLLRWHLNETPGNPACNTSEQVAARCKEKIISYLNEGLKLSGVAGT